MTISDCNLFVIQDILPSLLTINVNRCNFFLLWLVISEHLTSNRDYHNVRMSATFNSCLLKSFAVMSIFFSSSWISSSNKPGEL